MLTKQKYKKQMARILTALLVVAVGIGFVPQTGMQVYAEDGGVPAMVTGAESVLKSTANTDNAQTVYYGTNEENSIAWRVISFDGTGNKYTKSSGAMTLLASEILAWGQQFNPNEEQDNDYKGSSLQSAVDGLFDDLFSEKEQEAVKGRELAVDEYADDKYDGEKMYFSAGVSGEKVENAFLWPLSTAEAFYLPSDTVRSVGAWWLRSPGYMVNRAAVVNNNGNIFNIGDDVYSKYGVRPAFYLNLESVLFTSAAEGGKSSGTEGADALKAQSGLTNSGSEWKVTVKDTAHTGFSISKTTPTENGVSVEYTGAATVTNEYISAIITDESGAIKYYGRIATVSAAADTVTINTADKLGENDTLYVFNEHCNGDKKTDYASAMQKVMIPELISYDVTFKVVNGVWNDGTTTEKNVKLSKYDNEDKALVLQTGDIPEVGDKPDSGYKAGSWDVTPSEETVITGNTTYTYTYEPAPSHPSTSIDNAPVVLDDAPLTYTGQPVTPVIQTIGGKTLQEGRDYMIRYTQGDTLIEAPTDAGTYTMTITGKGNFSGSTSTEFTIGKAAGTLTASGNKVKAKSKTVKLKKAKKIAAERAYTIEGVIGDLAFSKVKANKKAGKFKVNATTGQIKVKKGLKKGKYELTVLISDPGDKNHETAEAEAIVKIRIRK